MTVAFGTFLSPLLLSFLTHNEGLPSLAVLGLGPTSPAILVRLLRDMSFLRMGIMFAHLCEQSHNGDSICFNICNELSQVAFKNRRIETPHILLKPTH